MAYNARPVKSFLIFALLLTAATGCVPSTPPVESDAPLRLRDEFAELRAASGLSGLAYAVVRQGEPVLTHAEGTRAGSDAPFTTSTPVSLGAATQAMTAILLLRQVEAGTLDLDRSVIEILPDATLPAAVTVRHLATHTSEGAPGQEFQYGPDRFSLLGEVLEEVTGKPFATLLDEHVLTPAGMQHTSAETGGAAGGVVSTIDDLVRFFAAFDRGELLSGDSHLALRRPSRHRRGLLPLGLAWYVQNVQGRLLLWSGGPADAGGGALFVRVVSSKTTLVALSDDRRLNDPFHLDFGDVRKSSYAMSFYRLFTVPPPPERLTLGRPAWTSGAIGSELARLENEARLVPHTEYSFEGELLGQILMRYDSGRDAEALELVGIAVERYGLARDNDPVVHALSPRFPERERRFLGVEVGERLLVEHPDNRKILLTQAELLLRGGKRDRALALLRKVRDLPNQDPEGVASVFATAGDTLAHAREAYRELD